MAIRQAYRGNPAEKQYQITQNFIGGLNTKEADDVVTDIEFRELLNVDLGNQGIITNRKGFKDLVVFNQMMENAVDENGDPTGFPTSVFRLAKVVKDSQNIVSLLNSFESLNDFRTSVQPRSYEMVFLFLINYDYYSLTISKDADELIETVVFKKLYEGIPVEFDLADESTAFIFGGSVILGEQTSEDIYVFLGDSGVGNRTVPIPQSPEGTVIKKVVIKEIRYKPQGQMPGGLSGDLTIKVKNKVTNQFENLYFIDDILPDDCRFDLGPDNPCLAGNFYRFSEEVPGFSEVEIDLEYLDNLTIDFQHTINGYGLTGGFLGPSVFSIDFEVTYGPDFDANAEVLKTYRSRISENNVEFLDSVYILPEFEAKVFEYDTTTDEVKEIEPYKPTPFDVKYVGFNVLAENPLTFIDDQGISNKNIEGVFLTIDGNKPVQNIPGGVFQINVIHTGTSFSTSEVGIEFFVNFGTDAQLEVFPVFRSAKDLGGLFVFEYNASNLSTYINKEITIRLFQIEKTVISTLQDKVLFADGKEIGDRFFSPVILNTLTGVTEGTELILWQNTSYQTVIIAPYNLIPQLTPRVESYANLAAFPATGFSTKIYFAEDTSKTYKYTSGTGYTEIFVAVLDRQVATDYFVEQNAALVTLSAKTSNIEFDPFVDFFVLESGSDILPTPVTKLDLTGFKIIEIDYRLVFYGGKTIWFSDLYQFNYIPNYNFLVLPLGTTDEIKRIVFFRGSYIIFTKDEIYRMSGSFGSSNFRLDSVNKFVGCIAPNTVRNVGNELFFLSRDGLYKLKSSIFQDNLENVEKIDKPIADDVQISEFVDSLLYDEQYILYYNEGEEYDTLRLYYEIDLGRSRNPFVRDIFTIKPELLVREDGRIFAVKNNRWYIYDEGYTDFMPEGEEDSSNYTYNCVIETPSIALGYPTHQKKFKNVFIKALHGDQITPLFITIKVDGYDVLTPDNSFPFINELSEVEYVTTTSPNIILQSSAFLGDLEIGATPLGEISQKVHKLSFGGKGKNIKVIIEQKLDSSFGILSIGYLYKLGKVKE